jgi:hypothetical protein
VRAGEGGAQKLSQHVSDSWSIITNDPKGT